MYCKSLTRYDRKESKAVKVGNVTVGNKMPIVVQTMTSTATSDIAGTVEQIIRTIGAGAEIVRITVPSLRDVDNLKEIYKNLRSKGYDIPLVADIHFNQKIALEAAKVVDKVRINPGNFADSKKFEKFDYTDEEYNSELKRIKSEFIPLLQICKENNTALRIGTNHGSLSDRIMSRYGDTPEGMAESAMEFLRICHEHNFQNVIISMKASNTMVMVQATRLLSKKMFEENLHYPMHLGVTEAGEGEDGRIKSAVGIGALLADGIGDTIRVSLTEEPEKEIPVAQKLVKHFSDHNSHEEIRNPDESLYLPYKFQRRKTKQVLDLGNGKVPVVLGNIDSGYAKETIPDYFVLESNIGDIDPKKKYIKRIANDEPIHEELGNVYPFISIEHPELNNYPGKCFVSILAKEVNQQNLTKLKKLNDKVIVISSDNTNFMADQRAAILEMMNSDISLPVIIRKQYSAYNVEDLQLWAAADYGALLLDGFCDGIWIENIVPLSNPQVCSIAFGILQATRMRISRPEYISCPSCGRTQFNIQETTKIIRKETSHLTGLKIGVMGCIVNGLGEMADADYGYIGGAPGKVNLYHHKELIKRSVPEELAVGELINLIKENGDWVEP